MSKCENCGEQTLMKDKKCISCEKALINGENWYKHESYSNDICDECFENHYGCCDQCSQKFRYYDDMTEGELGVSCEKCLEKYKQKQPIKISDYVEITCKLLPDDDVQDAGGLWDFAAQIALELLLKLQKEYEENDKLFDELHDMFGGAVYANDYCFQDIIYKKLRGQ